MQNLLDEDADEDADVVDADVPLPDTDGSSLYQILNVATDATSDDISKAYRTLAVAFHPDKQSSDANRDLAEKYFREIQRAHEILSNPQKRAVYDVLGEDGLSSNWDVGLKLKSAAEMRAEFATKLQQRKMEELEGLIRTKVETTVALDGTALFAPSEAFQMESVSIKQRLHHLRAHNVLLKNQFELPVNEATRVVFTTSVMAGRTRPIALSSNMTAQIRHRVSSKLNFNLTTPLLRPYSANFKANYIPDNDSFANLNVSCRSLSAPPPATITFGRSVGAGLTSFITVKSGMYRLGPWGSSVPDAHLSSNPPSLSLGLTSFSGWSLNTDSSVEGNTLNLNWSKKLNNDIRLRFGGAVTSTLGFNVSLTYEERVPYDSTLGCVFSCGTNGLVVRLKWTRLGQRLTLPVVLSREPEILLFSQLVVVSAASISLLHVAYLKPRRRRKLQKKVKDLREEHRDTFDTRAKEALEIQRMLNDQANRRTASEKAKDGLIILSAIYKQSKSEDSEEAKEMDVRIPLQVLVTNSQLLIPVGKSKSGLLGFSDVSPGRSKTLVIKYEFNCKLHEVIYEDKAAVTLPLRLHLVE